MSGDNTGHVPFLSRLPLEQDRPWIGYGVALALAVLAWWVRWEIGEGLPPGFPYLTFFPAVIVSAFFFGLRPGIVCAVLSGLAAWYFFIPPVDSFALSFNSALALAFYVFIVTVDIALVHWMQNANCDLLIERRRTLDLVDTREMLFRELQHRVGNNLQMVSSLIALQKRQLTDDAAKAALDEASRRLGLVGRIHRQLYDPAGAQLSLAAYIDQISRDVIAASGRDNLSYEFVKESDPALPADKAIPTALVVAEALNNAIEHGFGAGEKGHVIVTVAPSDAGVSVTIADDGKGLPDGFDLETSDSLGLRIARTLTQSLGGRFTMAAAPVGRGAIARLEIALAQPDPPVLG
ncbi:sensor histidine kinase [Tsuneonella amylolytica]|uniref:sensor histidine kinase n=1 Tax=Tsuneonella amylolytica TaxID=2338327 RepID=UPI000EA8C5FE|nr:histidine kinase dimerization/phosphoacceptor domain -containing protein [Tsuneonella amylolytica]